MKLLLPKFFITIISFMVLIFSTQKLNATSISVSGNITSNTTWSVDTVKVVGDVKLNYGATGIILTILPGTIIEFYGNYKLEFYKSNLHAIGTSTDSIYFICHDTTQLFNSFNNLGGWGGIILNDSKMNDSSILSYCVFKDVKSPWAPLNLVFNNNSTYITNCSFRGNNCYYGTSAGISVSASSNLYISKNSFKNNRGDFGGGIYCQNSTNINIDRNYILFNKARHSGAGISVNKCEINITSNFICNNYAEATNCYNTSGGGAIFLLGDSVTSYIANNVIANNYTDDLGGAICIYGLSICYNKGYANIINNTITNNYAKNGGGGLSCRLASPTITNNILYGNVHFANTLKNQCLILDDYSDPDFINSDIENGFSGIFIPNGGGYTYTGSYLNNINMNPSFINPSNGAGHNFDGFAADWRLQNSSPCINTGTLNNLGNLPNIDLWYNQRIQGASIEIGAYEAPAGGFDGINDYTNNSLISIYPNPAKGNISINYDQPFDKAVISIVNALGQTIETKQFNNSQKLNFDISSYSKGVYFLNATIEEKAMSSKLIVE